MTDDKKALRALTENALAAISWEEGAAPDFDAFFAAYLPGAVLAPSARPAIITTPGAFRARMEGQRSSGGLKSLVERPLGTSVQVFGNIGLVLSAFEMRANGGAPVRGLNTYLCVKDAGAWKIVGVAWDNESATAKLPADLATRTA